MVRGVQKGGGRRKPKDKILTTIDQEYFHVANIERRILIGCFCLISPLKRLGSLRASFLSRTNLISFFSALNFGILNFTKQI